MAKYIPTTPITQALLNAGTDSFSTEVNDAVSYISKAYRALIIANRNTRGFEKQDVDGGPLAYHHEQTYAQSLGTKEKAHRQQINEPPPVDPTSYRSQPAPTSGEQKAHRKNPDGTLKFRPETSGPLDYRFEEANKRTVRTFQKDYISIIDLDYSAKNVRKQYQYLKLPFTPKSLKYNIESSFVAIATMGRNNPHYHFTGSEDTLEFSIDWHSSVNHREDVLFFCRWLETLTKGDGYKQIPHRIKLAWGQDSIMFQDDVWIMVNASYELSEFVDSYNDTNDRNSFTRVGMLPQQAHQNITLKRVTQDNRFTDEIIGVFRHIQTGDLVKL